MCLTFGFGCLAAAFGAIGAAATTAGLKLCGECSKATTPGEPTIPLEKLNTIIQEQNKNFQNLSQMQINNRLENLKWFQSLSSTQKELLSGQAVLTLNQQKILKDLTTLVSKSKQLQTSIDMTQIISLYGDSVSNLLHIRSLFSDMNKDALGGIIDDFNSDDFIEATNHFRYGSTRSIKDVIKMLTSGHPLNSKSIWEVDSSFCGKSHAEFFSSLLYSSFCFRRIALEMEGKSMSKREAERFENDAENVNTSYESYCSCSNPPSVGNKVDWVRGSGNTKNYCYFILGSDKYPDESNNYEWGYSNSHAHCRESCERIGGHLASVQSQEENQFLFSILGGTYRGPPFRRTMLGGRGPGYTEVVCPNQCFQTTMPMGWIDDTDWGGYTFWSEDEPSSSWECLYFGDKFSGPEWISDTCN